MKQFVVFLSLLILTGCPDPGPDVTICIVDEASKGYRCAKAGSKAYALPLEKGTSLLCVSPHNMELILKACKLGSWPTIEPVNSILASDNWVCFSAQDRDRIKERCH